MPILFNKNRLTQCFITKSCDIFLYSKEYFRLWKIAYLLIGTMFLVIGSFLAKMPDWDIGISLIMALMSYFFSPISGAIIWSLINNEIKNYKILYLLLA